LKKTFLTTVGLVALGIAPALAADLPARTYTKAPAMVAPVYDWSGFYVGLNGGGASSHDCYTITSVAGTAIIPNSEGCHDATGGVVGGQAGYRWQSASWVFGVEAQGDWANLRGSNASLTALIPYTNQTKIDAIGLITGQVGYAWNSVLLYVKGGAAVTDNKYTANSTLPPFAGIDTTSETRWGAAVGVGFEYAFAQNWSLGLEYDHLFMGNNDVNSATGFLIADHIKEDVDLFTARINYKFGYYGEPMVARY
jgi:outer membrane immunogenic protein